MSKYLYLYRGPATPMDQFTEEQSAEQMQAWGAWMGRVGGALADGGAPFGARAAVADDGTAPTPTDLNGYTIVEAESLDAARRLLDGQRPGDRATHVTCAGDGEDGESPPTELRQARSDLRGTKEVQRFCEERDGDEPHHGVDRPYRLH